MNQDLKNTWAKYQELVELDPENPWYNSQYVTFLRENGFRAEARRAWRKAKTCQWCDKSLCPIIRSALDAGDLIFAQEVLSSFSEKEINENPELFALWHELQHFSEIDQLGESVYPFNLSINKRWKKSILLSDKIDNNLTLQRYYPGRIMAIKDNITTLVLADLERNLLIVKISTTEITKLSFGQRPKVGYYLEFGIYDEDKMIVKYHNILNN